MDMGKTKKTSVVGGKKKKGVAQPSLVVSDTEGHVVDLDNADNGKTGKTSRNGTIRHVYTTNSDMECIEEYLKPVYKDGEVILEVECGSNKAMMYLSKLCQGSKGPCVEFQGSWLTPNEFQYVSGRETAKDWKRSIRHQGKSMKLLITKGVLSVHSTVCDCDGCRLTSPVNRCRLAEKRQSVYSSNRTERLTIESFTSSQTSPQEDGDILEKSSQENDETLAIESKESPTEKKTPTKHCSPLRESRLSNIIEQLRSSKEREKSSGSPGLKKDFYEDEKRMRDENGNEGEDDVEQEPLLATPEPKPLAESESETEPNSPADCSGESLSENTDCGGADLQLATNAKTEAGTKSDSHGSSSEDSCPPATESATESPKDQDISLEDRPDDVPSPQDVDPVGGLTQALPNRVLDSSSVEDEGSQEEQATEITETEEDNAETGQLSTEESKVDNSRSPKDLHNSSDFEESPTEERIPSPCPSQKQSPKPACQMTPASETQALPHSVKKNPVAEKECSGKMSPKTDEDVRKIPKPRIAEQNVTKAQRAEIQSNKDSFPKPPRDTSPMDRRPEKDTNTKTLSVKKSVAAAPTQDFPQMLTCPAALPASVPEQLFTGEVNGAKYSDFIRLLASSHLGGHVPMLPDRLFGENLQAFPFAAGYNGMPHPFPGYPYFPHPVQMKDTPHFQLPPLAIPPPFLPSYMYRPLGLLPQAFIDPAKRVNPTPEPLKTSPTETSVEACRKRGRSETDIALDLSTKRLKFEEQSLTSFHQHDKKSPLRTSFKDKKSEQIRRENGVHNSTTKSVRVVDCDKRMESRTVMSERKACGPTVTCSCQAMRKADIRFWSVAEVGKFLRTLDGCSVYADVFREHRIDGKSLPLLTVEHLMHNIGMKLGPALLLTKTITKRLKVCKQAYRKCQKCDSLQPGGKVLNSHFGSIGHAM